MTSFTIHRSELLPALAAAREVVTRKNTIPILGHALLTVTGEGLTVQATDLDRQLTATAEIVACDAPGAFTLPAHLLHDIVAALPEAAEIVFRVDDGSARIASGRSRYALPVLPAADFPDISPGELPFAFECDPGPIAALFALCEPSISDEANRYYLNGVYLHRLAAHGAGNDELCGVATNGHTLVKATMAMPAFSRGEAAAMPGIIVPAAMAGHIAAAAKKKEMLEVEFSSTKIAVRQNGVRLLSKLIDGTFPDYNRVIPSGNEKLFTIEAGPAAAAFKRVAKLSRDSHAVKLAFGSGTLSLTCNNPDAGEAHEEIDATYVSGGDPIELGINSDYAQSVLGAMPASATAEFRLNDPGSPILVRQAAAADRLWVVMPMRV